MLTGRRILMTTDAVGGIWTYGVELASGLAAQGARVTLAVLGPGLDAGHRNQAEAAGVVVETGRAPEWLAEDEAELVVTAARIAALAHETGADLIHLNHPALAACVAFPCPVVGVAHSCVATWWEAVRGTPLPDDFAWRTAIVAKGYRAIDALIAPSRAFAEATQGVYRLPNAPRVVHNGRRVAEPDLTSRPSVRAVFSAGRLWDEGKNIAALDRAAATLPCPVRVAGPLQGPNRSRIAVVNADALGVLNETEVAQQLAARPIYAAPALYEPFGLSVLEAAQAGCALVLSDIPTFRELWEGVAVFVPPRDDQALRRALETVLNHPTDRDSLGQSARCRAQTYSVGGMIAGTVTIHQAVLDGPVRMPHMSAA